MARDNSNNTPLHLARTMLREDCTGHRLKLAHCASWNHPGSQQVNKRGFRFFIFTFFSELFLSFIPSLFYSFLSFLWLILKILLYIVCIIQPLSTVKAIAIPGKSTRETSSHERFVVLVWKDSPTQLTMQRNPHPSILRGSWNIC